MHGGVMREGSPRGAAILRNGERHIVKPRLCKGIGIGRFARRDRRDAIVEVPLVDHLASSPVN